jgi:hypothetical protein
MSNPIQDFLDWFHAQGEHVRAYTGGLAMATLPRDQSRQQSLAEEVEEIRRWSQPAAFEEWLSSEPGSRVRQLGKILFVRSVFAFLIYKNGHAEGREAIQKSNLEIAKALEQLAGQDTESLRFLRGDPEKLRDQSAQWDSASASWKRLIHGSLSDEMLEAWFDGMHGQ